jgi:hypothetical protein
MKTRFVSLAMSLLYLATTGCATTKSTETGYVPSAKIIEIKKDTPIYSTWDRWDEQQSSAFIMGKKQIVEGANLENILADDPDPRVVEKLKKANFWKTSGLIVGLIGAFTLLFGSWKKMPAQQGETYGTDWGLVDPGILLYTSGILVEHFTAGMYIREAQSIHNGRLNQAPGVSWNWSF